MKVKAKPKKLFFAIIIFLISAAAFYGLALLFWNIKPVKTVYYKGIAFTFRENVKDAEKIPAYPSEDSVGSIFWDYKIKTIVIMFKPDNASMGYYQANAFELTYKLTQIYATLRPLIIEKNFTAEAIESYNNITREEGKLKVILIPPTFANETSVKLGGNRVIISGKNYRDFDLAVIKTILCVMKHRGNYTYVG